MVAYYDRGRDNISRNSTHAVSAWVEGAIWPRPTPTSLSGHYVRVATAAENVAVVRQALESGGDALAEDVLFHFLPTVPELVAHFEGRDQVMTEWPKTLDDLTGGTFSARIADVWPVGIDLVVAHIEVEMTIEGVHHAGSSVQVVRVADGRVVEMFDIPSASL